MEKKFEFVVDMENFRGNAQSVIVNGRSLYNDKTAADYIADGYTIMSEEDFDKFVKEYEKSLCNDWKEVFEEDYENALNVLPPKRWYNGGFYLGECYSGSLYSFYQELDGKFYTSLQSIYTARDEILENLKQFVSNK